MSRSQQHINIGLYPKKASAELISGVWTHKSSVSDQAGLIADVTDTTGFAQCALLKLSSVDWMYLGTILGFNGFINLLNNAFFFGNVNALNFYLMNPTAGLHQIFVNGVGYTFSTTALDLGTNNLNTTGNFTDGVTPIKSGHTHTGSGSEGAIIPHAATTPARAFATTYTNTGPRPKIVYGNVNVRDTGGGTGQGFIDCKTDANSPPTTVVQRSGNYTAGMVATQQIQYPFYFVVQPSMRYRVDATAVNASVTLDRWNEVDF